MQRTILKKGMFLIVLGLIAYWALFRHHRAPAKEDPNAGTLKRFQEKMDSLGVKPGDTVEISY